MKIKMLTTKCGPVATENWHEGQVREVSDAEAKLQVKLGHAIALGSYEKATIKPSEKAVVIPVETAIVVPPEVAVVPEPVVEPTINLAPEWGTK